MNLFNVRARGQTWGATNGQKINDLSLYFSSNILFHYFLSASLFLSFGCPDQEVNVVKLRNFVDNLQAEGLLYKSLGHRPRYYERAVCSLKAFVIESSEGA